MRRALSLLIAITLILGAVPVGAAPSYAAEESIVHRQVALGFFDVWKHSNGTWQDTNPSANDGKDKPGDTGKRTTVTYRVPANVLEQYDLTRVETVFPFGEDEYTAAGGRAGETWDRFNDRWYRHRAEITGITADQNTVVKGEAKVTWTLDLTSPDLQPYDLKKPEVRELLDLPDDPRLNDMSEGYRYMLPGYVTWYGTPKHKPVSPNLSVTYFDPGCETEPAQAASADPNVWRLAENKTYVAKPGEKYTATVKFRVSDPDHPTKVNSPPYLPVIAAVHKVGDMYYQAELSGNDVVKSDGYSGGIGGGVIPKGITVYSANFTQTGQEITAQFKWTAEEGADQTTLIVVINKHYPAMPPNGLPYTLWFYAEDYPQADVDSPEYWESVTHDSPVYQDNVAVANIKIQAPPDLYVKTLNPGTSETEPGQKYDGTVTFGLKDYSGPVQAKLELTHNGYGVPGVNGEMATFSPGEVKTFDFSFTGQDKDSTLVAKIRPVEVSTDANWDNNSKQVTVPVRRVDLIAKIDNKPGALDVGDDYRFDGTLINNSERTVTTNYVWRSRGQVKVNQSLTLSPHQQKKVSFNFTMPNVSEGSEVRVEMEINPGRNKPDKEVRWDNNKDTTDILAFVSEIHEGGYQPPWLKK